MECLKKRWVIELFLLYIFSDGSVAKICQNLKLNEDISIRCGGVKAVPMDVQGENLSQEPKEKENKNKKMSN